MTDTSASASNRRVIAPWPGDENLAYLQGGLEVTGTRTLYLSGTGSTDEGAVVHVDDILGQVMQSLDNTGLILSEAGYEWKDVVRLNWYIKASHLGEFWEKAHGPFLTRVQADGCRATGVLLGVETLALPTMLCEFEATAVRA